MVESAGARKRQKLEHINPESPATAVGVETQEEKREVRIIFRNTEGQETGDEIQVSASTSKIDLNKILDQILQPEEKQVYQFYLDDDKEVKGSIGEVLDRIHKAAEAEKNKAKKGPIVASVV